MGLQHISKIYLTKYNKIFITRQRNIREEHITKADTGMSLLKFWMKKAGFVSAHWDGTAETEEKIKELTKATIRCIPLK